MAATGTAPRKGAAVRRQATPAKTSGGGRQDRDALASRLIDEAGRILSSEGAGALTLRRLAAASGTSTMAVYTLFGDKTGLLAAMYREGFYRLGQASAQAAAHTDDPLDALASLGLAYRATALANPHLYDLMFGRPIPTFAPDEETQAVAEAAYRPLVDAVQRCLDDDALVTAHGIDDAERIAFHLWATSHGMVSLELAGHLDLGDAAARERGYVEAMVLSSLPFLPTA
ncbi:MAG: TetR/AcrR family transcriptional regulator [Frankiales bacterium]|nr:TetR/AcrR family transcriptional regulator [Frankiales bacterium]